MKPLYETLATWITHNSCEFDFNEWNRLPNFQLFAVIKIFKIEKFFSDLALSSACSLNFLALYVYIVYKMVPT